jgi:transcription termination factor NusB
MHLHIAMRSSHLLLLYVYRSFHMANRHLARSVVLQTLFEWDTSHADESTVPEMLTRNVDEFGGEDTDKAFMETLITGVLAKRADLDLVIGKAAPDWPIEKIAPVDRNILRIGLFELLFADLVHDVFGRWTLSTGHIENDSTPEIGVKRVVKEELDVDGTVEDMVGENEYIASHPEKGKIRKHVYFYLVKAPFETLTLKKTGGLDDSKWFRLTDILDLNFYDDMLPIVTAAVQKLLDRASAKKERTHA